MPHSEAHLASLAEKRRLWWRNALINLCFIASWFFFATILSVYNKWMFSKEHLNFSFPIFVTSLHMWVQFGLAAILRKFWARTFRPDRDPSWSDCCKKVAPTAATTSLDIGMSNLSLKTISLSFYTMCKSSSLIFVLGFAFLFKFEVFSWRLVGVILLITSGVVLMVASETHFILGGFLLVMSASVLGGLRWALTQILLKDKKLGMDNPAATIYWLAPWMGITLAILSPIIESWADMFRSEFFSGIWMALRTMAILSTPGVIAFAMVMSEYYILQRAGMVPLSIAGIAKEVTTITISAWLFGDELTPLNMTGVGITVAGITLFTYHKYRKSIESTVPLDAHGNPVETGGQLNGSIIESNGYHVELDETLHLTANDNNDLDTTDGTTIFSYADEEDDGVFRRTHNSEMITSSAEFGGRVTQ